MDMMTIWTSGVPLSQAHLRFGPKDKVEAYRQFRNQNNLGSLVDKLVKKTNEGHTVVDVLNEANEPLAIAGQLEKELQGQIVRWLRQEKLIALGFSCPRRAEDEPQEVPIDLLDGQIRWSNDSLAANGLKMEGIRLVSVAWIEKQLANLSTKSTLAPIEPAPSPSPAGRPSRKDHIKEAFLSLCEAGEIDFAVPMTLCYPKVRAWVMAKRPNEDQSDIGLGDKVMANVVNPLFKAYK